MIKKAVVTGAGGAVGWGLVKALVSHGAKVTILGRSKPALDYIDKSNIKLITCALEDYAHFETDETADAFFHLAWGGTYGSDRNNAALQNDNVRYALDAVRLAKKMGCTSFVGVGSQAEYGAVPYGTKLSPSLPCKPQNEYGKAKLKAFQSANELCSELGIKFNWCRIISAYGIGDRSHTMIMQTVAKLDSGCDCDFTPCDQMWDYMNNEDVGEALYLTAESGKNGSVYVLGSGAPAPLKDYIHRLYRAVGNTAAKCNFGAINYFENQPMYLCADIGELTRDTGFAPRVSFDDGIARTVQWYREKSEI